MDSDVTSKLPVKPGDIIPRALVDARHPDQARLLNDWRFWRTTYEGTGGYAPYVDPVLVQDTPPTDDGSATVSSVVSARETWLWKHPREKAKFDRRVMQAYNLNVVRRVVTSLVGFLLKKPPSRDDYPPEVLAWMANASKDGLSWDQMVRTRIAPQLMTYGWLPALVHHEQTPALTRAQEIELGAGPWATIICPESLMDWCDDGRGGFAWLKYREPIDTTPDPLQKQHAIGWRTTYLTKGGWWYCDHDDKQADVAVAAAGEWPGAMPLTVWRVAGGSLISGACPTQRELFNVLSLEQEQERETAFSMLVMEDPGKNQKVKIVSTGSDNALLVRENCTTKPYWLSIDGTILERLDSKIRRLVAQILAEFSLEFDEGADTGVAMSFKMSKVTRLLVDLSSAFAVGEIQTHRHVAAALGVTMPDKAASTWPKRFDETDIEREMKGLSDLLLMSPGPTFSANARYRAAQAAMPDLDEATLAKGWKEIEAAAEEEESADEKMGEIGQAAALAMAEQPDPVEVPEPEAE